MYRVYEQMEAGTLDPEELVRIIEDDAVEDDYYVWPYPGQSVPVADMLDAMITWSDNTAARALARRVGGWGSVEAVGWELGMPQTYLEGGYFRTSPADMLTFMEKLAAGELVNAEASRSMIELLKRQTFNDMIPALLPEDVEVAHKTGELAGIRNDVGIVYGPAASLAISIYSSEAAPDEATEVARQVSLDAYVHFAGGAGPTEDDDSNVASSSVPAGYPPQP